MSLLNQTNLAGVSINAIYKKSLRYLTSDNLLQVTMRGRRQGREVQTLATLTATVPCARLTVLTLAFVSIMTTVAGD